MTRDNRTREEIIEDTINEMDTVDVIDLYNQYCVRNNYTYDIIYPMEEFNDIVEQRYLNRDNVDLYSIIKNLHDNLFNPYAKYFYMDWDNEVYTIDGYNIPEMVEDELPKIIECIDTEETSLGNQYIRDILDDEDIKKQDEEIYISEKKIENYLNSHSDDELIKKCRVPMYFVNMGIFDINKLSDIRAKNVDNQVEIIKKAEKNGYIKKTDKYLVCTTDPTAISEYYTFTNLNDLTCPISKEFNPNKIVEQWTTERIANHIFKSNYYRIDKNISNVLDNYYYKENTTQNQNIKDKSTDAEL